MPRSLNTMLALKHVKLRAFVLDELQTLLDADVGNGNNRNAALSIALIDEGRNASGEFQVFKVRAQSLLLKRLQPDGTWKDEQDPDGGVTSQLGFRLIIDTDGRLRMLDATTGKRYARPDEAEVEASARRQMEERMQAEAELLEIAQQQQEEELAFADLLLQRRAELAANQAALDAAREQALRLSAEEQELLQMRQASELQLSSLNQLRKRHEEQANVLRQELNEQQAALESATEQARRDAEAERQQAEELARALIAKLRDSASDSVIWREQARQMLEQAPLDLAYDAGLSGLQPVQNEAGRFRMRPSVLAGLLLCAGMAGAAGFANLAPHAHVAAASVPHAPLVAGLTAEAAPAASVSRNANGHLQLSYELSAHATQQQFTQQSIQSADVAMQKHRKPAAEGGKVALQLAMAAKQ